MSDIKKVLTDEIRRLAKKEIKLAIEPLNAKIIALKKQISEINKNFSSPKQEVIKKPKKEVEQPSVQTKIRLNADRIKKIREKLNLTQGAIAAILGVSKPAYCTWEQGKQIPSNKTKIKIAALRKMSPQQAKKIIDDMGIKQGTPRKLKYVKKDESETNTQD